MQETFIFSSSKQLDSFDYLVGISLVTTRVYVISLSAASL